MWTKYNEKDEENGKNIAHYNEQARELQSAQTDLESKTIYIGTLNSQLHEKNVVISELYSEIKGFILFFNSSFNQFLTGVH